MLDAGREYSLQQTLDEHSSSITAVKFAGGGRVIETHSATYHQHHPYPSPHCHLPSATVRRVCLSWGILDSCWEAWGWMGRQVECKLLVRGVLSQPGWLRIGVKESPGLEVSILM